MSTNTLSPRDIRMENRNSRRDSTESLWAYPSDSKDLNEAAATRNLPSALPQVAEAAEQTATGSAKAGPNLDVDDFLNINSEEAKEAKEGIEPHEADTFSSDEEEDLQAAPDQAAAQDREVEELAMVCLERIYIFWAKSLQWRRSHGSKSQSLSFLSSTVSVAQI